MVVDGPSCKAHLENIASKTEAMIDAAAGLTMGFYDPGLFQPATCPVNSAPYRATADATYLMIHDHSWGFVTSRRDLH
eukprot:3174045-Amphidinium_carterae.1